MTNVNDLREIATNCDEVEFYTSATMSYPHTDNVESIDIDFDDLKDRVDCDYYEMDEEDYNESLMANCGDTVDFEDVYGSSHAKVLVVVLNAEKPFRKGDGDNVWECWTQRDGEKAELYDSGCYIEEARKWLRDRLFAITERGKQYTSFEEAENDGAFSAAKDKDGEVYSFGYDVMNYYIKREDEA